MEPSLQRKISPSQPAIPPFFPEQGLLAASAGSAQTDRRKRAVEAKSPNFIGEASVRMMAACYLRRAPCAFASAPITWSYPSLDRSFQRGL